MAMFKGFKPQGLQKIATRMGYAGRMENFDEYLKQNPDKEREMIVYRARAEEMARGGAVVKKMQVGGTPTQSTPSTTPIQQAYVPTLGEAEGQVPAYGTTGDTKGIGDVTSTLAQTGAIPVGAVTQPQLTPVMQEQMIAPTTGQLTTTPVAPTYGADTAQAGAPTQVTSTQMQAAQATPAVQTAVQANQAAQADVTDPRAQVLAAQQTASSVSDLTAAQGTATLMDNPVQRQIQQGELIDGVADAEKASTYTEQVQAHCHSK